MGREKERETEKAQEIEVHAVKQLLDWKKTVERSMNLSNEEKVEGLKAVEELQGYLGTI